MLILSFLFFSPCREFQEKILKICLIQYEDGASRFLAWHKDCKHKETASSALYLHVHPWAQVLNRGMVRHRLEAAESYSTIDQHKGQSQRCSLFPVIVFLRNLIL